MACRISFRTHFSFKHKLRLSFYRHCYKHRGQSQPFVTQYVLRKVDNKVTSLKSYNIYSEYIWTVIKSEKNYSLDIKTPLRPNINTLKISISSLHLVKIYKMY